jgi:predicted nucleic acid-binding protein
LARSDEETANAFWSTMIAHDVIDFTADLAAAAADLAQAHKLAMVDAIILASARENDAELWTQDDNFKGLDGVRYVEKPPAV